MGPGDFRRYHYWTRREDELILAYRPGGGRTLRDLADDLGRTYPATRFRRKALLAGTVVPGQQYECRRCHRELPEGQKQGHCPDCRKGAKGRWLARRYRAGLEATEAGAQRRYERWTEEDSRAVLEGPVTVERARALGRTLAACQCQRWRELRKLRRGAA